ncbi:LOW QUALITY PROTEIN: lymphocyte antigen 6 complex locus protein G6c [Lontra canadensis]|uniref:LOW QUALITY PROTEIN: lymphocyte antigen 6 complex locus protein G6c n=1 Tax=Lontra canadensis TaxID=76717 RepID=UPI0013F35B5A|nr:LOW QUALITY PROTEIN: lymphocyte antigen 6 complex locus protein G6c [Lontra canadensis]
MGKEGPSEAGKGGTFGIINSKKATNSQSWIPETLLCQLLHLLPSPGTLIMKGFLLLILSALLCWVSADIRCHSCYKVPVLGCVDRQSCRLDPGQQCLTTNVYLGKMWVFSNLRCGTPEEPCRETFNQTNHKLGLTYNTTCCNKDNCNSPAPRPTPALALVLLTSVAGLGLWLLH